LNAAKEDGWRILGAAASAPSGMDTECLDLQDVKAGESQPPTILVLGSEGHGLRTLVAKACSGFVRVPGSESTSVGGDTNAGVDSLNVSVTGGIMLWHFLNGKN
jgi:21S rRNA (GM2251-2'-O)-methyltransferase